LPAIYCTAINDTDVVGIQASFPTTQASQVAVGACVHGLYGFPQRLCNPNGNTADGVWASTVLANPCNSERGRGARRRPAPRPDRGRCR